MSDKLVLAANTIRMLAADAVEKANSGHPGMPMGAADYGVVLFLKHLNFNGADPQWLNRDRFVLSNGHGSMFLYGMLHLCGYDVSLEDIKNFRQWESNTPGHPEVHVTPGVECTTGPLGQGISNAVGMAIGQKLLAARYNTPDFSIINHKVFCFVGDGCLMEGISSESSSIAGHLALDNLIVIYDDNHISIAGHTKLAFTEDVCKRYEAYGWHTEKIDGHDFEAIDRALAGAVSRKGKPTLIAARTIIGKGSPNKADTHDVHGAPLGKKELESTKQALGWPLEPTFYIPKEVSELFQKRITELKAKYNQWRDSFQKWEKTNPQKATELKAQRELSVPKDIQQKFLEAVKPAVANSTRKLSGAVLQVASREVGALIGGSADLEPSTLTLIKDSTDINAQSFTGKNLRFGVREHGMGAIMNGLACYGSFIPYGSTFLCFSDYMRPAIRLAALSHLPGLFIFTHDSVFLGEDGPTHQPIEHLAALRLIPNLYVLRPGDGAETAICYEIALTRRNGPCALIFTRQNLEPIERKNGFDFNEIKRGAYTVYESALKTKNPDVVIIATGSELPLAVAAAKLLPAETSLRVVSMPCWELFQEQPTDYHQALIPKDSKKVTIEAGHTLTWPGMIDGDPAQTLCIGINRFGASAPAEVIADHLGLTKEKVAARIKEFLANR